jgi:hypothetical protein
VILVDHVLCFVWQENNLVLALSTIHFPTGFVERERRRPGEKSINAKIAQKLFDNDSKKKLLIPIFIDDHNHNMNGADIGNQQMLILLI